MTVTGKVTSHDGTSIAFERLGSGRPVIMVAGALQGRATYHPLAEALSRHLTVFNYDRRGRGDSGDTAPYAVEREVEDLAALIAEAGGSASLYGHSSGAALVLHAAARGLPIDRIVLHEPPFGPDTEEQRQAEREEAERFRALLARDRRADAVELFYSSIGMPPDVVAGLARDPSMLAHAPTILYDFETMDDRSRGGRTPSEQASAVTTPALVIAGGASPQWMIDTSRALAEALPNGRLHILDDQEHVVPPDILAPVVAEFIG